MAERPYDPILDGDVYLPALPRDLYPGVTCERVEGDADLGPPGIQFDPGGRPVAYVIAPVPPRRTRDADLPQVGSFHG